MSREFDQKTFVKSVSSLPGVYAMLDHEGRYLYVGKASNLRKRLRSYFGATDRPTRLKRMISQVADIQVHITNTESEALLLENNLIKAHRPHYNILLRDDKSYPYIRLTLNQDFPGLSLYRGSLKQPGRYFGPFSNAGAARETLSQIQKIIPVRQCQDSYFRNRSRPCLQYQIKRCSAPCVGLVESQSYSSDIQDSIMLLEGKSEKLARLLQDRMHESAGKLDYESAGRYRDRISALRRVQETQYVSGRANNTDVFVAVREAHLTCVSVMSIRNGQNLGSRHFFQSAVLDETTSQVLKAILPQYYLSNPIPPELIVSPAVSGASKLADFFSKRAERKIYIKTRVRDFRAQWLQLAELNATERLARHLASRESYTDRLKDLSQRLGLEGLPMRLECFDISHSSGEAPVGSCVVFDQEGPVPSQYRRFNIRDVTPGDDYGAIRQALERRYRRVTETEQVVPDILFVDGGKGQHAIAEAVLNEFLLGDVTVVAVAKGADRNAGRERLYVSGVVRALTLPRTSTALHLVQQIRDEAHRFAITGHRLRRSRARLNSVLQDIPGIGATRRQSLLHHFGGLQQVQRAPVEDLSKAPGISVSLAERIYHYFKQN